jgi:TRAP-type mannitol/chloroaromatic compound transport system permease small subunit
MDQFPHNRFSLHIDSLLNRIGEWISWVWLVLLLVIALNVVMRYLFSQGRIEFEEIQWHLYSIGFLFGLSYAYGNDAHIRVDVMREKWSLTTRAWIELYGIILLLLPFLFLVIWAAVPFIAYSWQTNEVSEAPGGLPYRFAIKSVLLIGFLLLLLSVLARLSRVWQFLFHGDENSG